MFAFFVSDRINTSLRVVLQQASDTRAFQMSYWSAVLSTTAHFEVEAEVPSMALRLITC